jgi:hypothetical protein
MLTMRELQGAIIVSSLFQALLGYSGLMSVLLRYSYNIWLQMYYKLRYYFNYHFQNVSRGVWHAISDLPSHVIAALSHCTES